MPSSATITAFTIFSPLTTIKSSEMNVNLGNFRGHFIPIEPSSAAAAVTQTYSLGTYDHRWKYLYGNVAPKIDSTTGSFTLSHTNHVVLMDCTAATLTATLPTAVGFFGMLIIKNVGTAGKTLKIATAGGQTMDGTASSNLVDLESTTLISDETNWWSI